MSKTILTTGGIPTATTANTIQYWPLAVTSIEGPSSVETFKQIVHRTPGTLSKLYVRVTANTINGTSAVHIRRNNITVMSVGIGPNATGEFENSTDTVSVTAGDKLCYQTGPGAATGTMTISIFSVLFEPTNNTETVSRLASAGPSAPYATASVSRYNQLAGNQTSTNTNEILGQTDIVQAGTGEEPSSICFS